MLKLTKTVALVVAIGLLLTVGLAPLPVRAHEQESEGSITALLHVTPHDKPIVTRPAKIEIAIKSTAGKFSFSNCDCTVSVNRNGAQITVLPLQAISARVSSNPYTFTDPGAYQLVVRGQSLNGAESNETFEPFSFTYPVTVQDHVDGVPAIVWIGVATIIALALAVAISMSTVPKRFKL